MPIDLIDTIKPKNNGTFPMVEAEDVVVGKGTADEKRLPEALAEAGKVAAVDTAMPGTPADDHVPSTQLLKEELAKKLSTSGGTIAGDVSFASENNVLKVNKIQSVVGTPIYDTTGGRGFNFLGLYTLCGYTGPGQRGKVFFTQENATTNWIDVTTLKEGGTPLANKYAAKSHQHAASDITGLPTVTVDEALSDTSENPVQNKAVKAALDTKATMQATSMSITLSGAGALFGFTNDDPDGTIEFHFKAGSERRFAIASKEYVDGLVGDIKTALAAI